MSSIPSPSSVGSHAVSSLLSNRRKSTLAMAALAPTAAGGRQKSASELMLEDAVRWVLWCHSQRALHVSPECKRLLTLERLSVGAQQWLLQVRTRAQPDARPDTYLLFSFFFFFFFPFLWVLFSSNKKSPAHLRRLRENFCLVWSLSVCGRSPIE